MKIDARSLPRVTQNPGAWRVILLHGEDTGLIRERAQDATRKIAGSTDDPFRVSVLDKETHDRLEEEATALSLMGGRRVVRVRDASDSLLKAVSHVLEQPTDTVVILESPSLPSRSKLRALLEKRPDCASVGCYPEEGRTLEATITQMLAAHTVRIEPDALHWLMGRLGADRGPPAAKWKNWPCMRATPAHSRWMTPVPALEMLAAFPLRTPLLPPRKVAARMLIWLLSGLWRRAPAPLP